jgi:hypothetical protein
VTVSQYLVGGAMLANAIAGHLLYRAAFADAGHEPVLAATVLGLVVAGIAIQIVVRPVSWALDLARGAAVGMLLGLAGIGLLTFVAANFENGLSRQGLGSAAALLLGLLVAQLTILFGSARIEGVGVGDSAPAIARGAFRFWLLVIGVSFLMHMVERLQPVG